MPLLTSPIDGTPMRQLNRFGIELDICPTSGGVWLDRGELEKLIALIKETATEDRQQMVTQHAPSNHMPQAGYQQRSNFNDRDDDDDDDDDDDYRSNRHHSGSNNDHYQKTGPHKKKSGMSRLMEVFDF